MLGVNNMNIDELLKKRLLFFFTSFVFIVLTTISSSYAILNKNNVENSKVINNGILDVVYKNGMNAIDSGYPMSYEQGINDSPSNIIELINNSNEDVRYRLNINYSTDSNSLDSKKILYSINNSKPEILGNNNIYEDIVGKESKSTLDIKIWAYDKLVTNDDQGKKIDISFEVLEY